MFSDLHLTAQVVKGPHRELDDMAESTFDDAYPSDLFAALG